MLKIYQICDITMEPNKNRFQVARHSRRLTVKFLHLVTVSETNINNNDNIFSSLTCFQIYLTFASEPIPGSPFACKVYNVNAIQVRECPKGIVGKPVTFLVETSRAGPGNLEVTGKLWKISVDLYLGFGPFIMPIQKLLVVKS